MERHCRRHQGRTVSAGGAHSATQRGTPQHQHLRNRRVLVQSDGSSMSMKTIQQAVERAARRANVKPGVHILRHTFCSHLAMKGAAPRQIQELAGHKDLSTTMRYMHLSPLSRRQAIQLLDAPVPGKHTGNGLEKLGIRKFPKENGGGGGSRTRVRKHVVVGLYMRVRI